MTAPWPPDSGFMKSAQQRLHVEWVNEEGESLLPYDIRLSFSDGRVVYVEVKTTIAAEKRLFEISLPELECAREHKDNYLVARVFLSSLPDDDGPSHRVVIFKSIYELIEAKGVDLLLRF